MSGTLDFPNTLQEIRGAMVITKLLNTKLIKHLLNINKS